MTWTKFMPEKPGHYWALRSDGKEPSMVEIAYFIAGSKVKLCRLPYPTISHYLPLTD